MPAVNFNKTNTRHRDMSLGLMTRVNPTQYPSALAS